MLLGEREQALARLRRAVEGITIIRGFRKTRTTTACVLIPNTSASWKKFGSTGNNTNTLSECRNVR
jgi:hypothetical protein